MKGRALLLATMPLVGCAYFNGIYNARQAEKKGDALLRKGRSADADSLYATAAQKAESVLVHHPRSRWADDALFIAGWSWAMANECERAEPRLAAFLALRTEPVERQGRATLALGVCRVRQGRYAEARALVAPLADTMPNSADPQLAREASLWAAVASVSLGETDSARVYLRGANGPRAEWELARAFMARHDFPAAESLLVRRAAHGDYRPDLLEHLGALWRAGRENAVQRIVARYDASRAPGEDRAKLHLFVGDLALESGRDSAARVHFAAAERLSRDTLILQTAVARLAAAELRGLTTVVDVQNVIARARARAGTSAALRRLDEQLLLLEMLHDRDDDTGASLFLAAEVARDSLHAPALAHALFLRVAELPRSPLAAKALLAIGQLEPHSSGAFGDRGDTLVAGAAFGALAAPRQKAPGREPGDSGVSSPFDPLEQLLDRTWVAVHAQYADSLRRLRPDTTSSPGGAELPAGFPPPAPRSPTARVDSSGGAVHQ
jgi:hypothetical protein